MGIQLFQSYIKKVYAQACKTKWDNITYDNLYIDLNHVLHHVCYLAKDCDDLLARFKDYLNKIILYIKPKKRVYLAADGPAPMAKMMLQRKRRLDTVKTLDTELNLNDLKKNLNLNLTPGTDFMMKLEKELSGFIEYITKKYNVNVITSITDADEGEIKIRYKLQQFQKKYPTETHLVYSGDSDMILLLFTCDDLSNIYQIIDKNVIIHFGTLLDLHRLKFGKTESDKYDFVFINLMMGNDYIPKVSLIKLETIWEAYKTVSRNRPKGLITFNMNEITTINNINTNNINTNTDNTDNTTDKFIMKVDQIFIHDLLYIATKKSPSYLLNNFDFFDLRDASYINYVNGLYWCFAMYTTGNCSDYRYIYDHQTSPHVTGVIWTIIFNNMYNITKTKSIDVDLYGILLIPEKANLLLSKEQRLIAEKLVKVHPIIYEEGRCIKCKNYSKKLNELQVKLKNYDSDSEERYEISKQLGKLNKSFSNHREIHEKLTATTIDTISKTFITIRDELRETVSLDDSFDDENSNIKPYNPIKKTNIPKKRIF